MELDDYLKTLKAIRESMGDVSDAMYEMEKSYLIQSKATKDYIKNLTSQDLKDKQVKDSLKAHNKILKDKRDELIKLAKTQKEFEREQEKLRSAINRATKGIKDYVNDLDDLVSGVGRGVSSFAKLAGVAGITSFSFDSLGETILKYNKNLFLISRSQQAAGTGMNDMANALDYVKNSTVLSQIEFTNLSNTILDGFVGVKPGMTDIAKILGRWGDQFGYDYESAKELFEIQARFPQLYDKINEGLKIADNINKGNSTDKEKERLQIIRSQALALASAGNESSRTNDLILKSTIPISGAQKELNETEKKRQQTVKELQDLQLEFAKEFQPLLKNILDISTNVLKVLNGFSKPAAVMAGLGVVTLGFVKTLIDVGVWAKKAGIEIAVCETVTKRAGLAMDAFGKAAKAAWVSAAGPIGLIAAAAAYTTYQVIQMNKANEEINKTEGQCIEDKMYIKKISKEQLGLTSLQKDKVAELYKEQAKEGMSIKEAYELQHKIIEQVKTMNLEIEKQAKEYEVISLSVSKTLQILGEVSGATKDIAGVSEEFGQNAKDAYEILTKISELELSESAKRLGSSLKLAIDILKTQMPELKIDIKGNPVDVIKRVQQASLGLNLSLEKQLAFQNAIKQATVDSADYRKKEGDITRNTTSDIEAGVTQQERFTSAYESRLNTQRKMMESFQFGLGASVEMMQKQVELSYQLAKGYEDADITFQNVLKDKKIATDVDIKAIQNAKTQAEAEGYIKNTMKKTGKEADLLNQYAFEHQKLSQKSMEQYQKIYDLTKDVREGYLDAIREMSVGAGEFSKIIGTQEMGVTQLMKSVKDVTGVATLNTMALGGLQEQVLTTKGIGTQITGQYTTSGINFIGKEKQEERNQRIADYDASKKKVEDMMKGNYKGPAPTAGSALASGAEDYIRSSGTTGEITGGKAVIPGDYTSSVNIGVKEQRFNQGDTSATRADARTSGAMGADILNRTSAPLPAEGPVITIRLESGLKGDIEQAKGLRVELLHGVSSSG